jgi:predicted porin
MNALRLTTLGLAALACAQAAAQQAPAPQAAERRASGSSVELYGSLTAAVVRKTGQTGNTSVWDLSNSLLAASYFGVRGSEDLGGGMSAQFRLESQLATDTGAGGATFGANNKFWARQSFVGLNVNPAVAITAGRQFHAATDRVIRSMDVYNVAGTSLHSTPLALLGVNRFAGNDGRADDSVKLRFTMPGIQAGASASLDDGAGRNYTVDAAWVTPQLTIGAWAAQFNSPTLVAATGRRPSNDLWGIGGNGLVGPVRLYLHYLEGELEPTVANRLTQTNKMIHLGANWSVTPQITLKLAAYHDKGKAMNGVAGRDGTKKTYVTSAEYFLSKRTSLHVAATSNSFSGGYRLDPLNINGLGRDPSLSSTSTFSTGIRHDF